MEIFEKGFWCDKTSQFIKPKKTVHNLDFCPECADLLPDEEHTKVILVEFTEYKYAQKQLRKLRV